MFIILYNVCLLSFDMICLLNINITHLCFKASSFKGPQALVDKLTQPRDTPSSLRLGQAPELIQLLLGHLLFGIVVGQRLNHLDTISTPKYAYEGGMVATPAVSIHKYFHMNGKYLRLLQKQGRTLRYFPFPDLVLLTDLVFQRHTWYVLMLSSRV